MARTPRIQAPARPTSRRPPRLRREDSGFSLIETMVAVTLLAVGLLTVDGALTAALSKVLTAPTDLVARQKAIEAIESVYAARDSRTLTWAQIRNESNGGVFRDEAQPIRAAGADGLVNTADDGDVEVAIEPGPDGLLGTADDVSMPLSNYTRQVLISDVSFSLRRITVTVTVTNSKGTRTYTITTLISSYA